MPRAPWNRPGRSPYDVLGVESGADADTIRSAHRALAKRLHPDAGGSVDEMQELNAAQQAALSALSGRTTAPEAADRRRSAAPRRRPAGTTGVRRDHPSFTIEALPAVAFEALLVAGEAIGRVVGDDPPYLLQAHLDGPNACWSQLELLPDAGATSVALTVASPETGATIDIDLVRDRWIAALNQLDWTDPESPRPPS